MEKYTGINIAAVVATGAATLGFIATLFKMFGLSKAFDRQASANSTFQKKMEASIIVQDKKIGDHDLDIISMQKTTSDEFSDMREHLREFYMDRNQVMEEIRRLKTEKLRMFNIVESKLDTLERLVREMKNQQFEDMKAEIERLRK